MNLITHNILPFILFWTIRLNKINTIIYLYPHTLQQINTLEKIERDIILTTAWTTTFLTINYHITILIKKKNTKGILITLYTKIIRRMIIFLILLFLLNLINNTIQTNNLTLKLRIKKFYQFFIISSIILFFIFNKKNKWKIERIIYIPIITLTIILRPAEQTIRTLTTLTLIFLIKF